MSQYVFHADPGHGWLEVEYAELNRLGLAAQITVYSYMHGDRVYLEEDVDAPAFLAAKKGLGEKVDIVEHYEDPTPIRQYSSYQL